MANEEKSENVLVSAAKLVGAAAGKIASLTGTHESGGAAPQTQAAPKPAAKLVKKNKSRLPRRLKKQMKKQNTAAV